MAEPVAIVLAAGAGQRRNSDLPKVVHKVCGRALVNWVVDALRRTGIRRIVVVGGHQADKPESFSLGLNEGLPFRM